MHEVATGAATGQELSAEKAFLTGPQERSRARSRWTRARPSSSARRWARPASTSRTAGSTPTPTTLSNIQAGTTDFTIYQDPYLQGFLPTLYFYLYNISGGTVAPPDTDTGLTIITKSNVKPYTTSSRFQGSTTAQKYIPRPSGAISNPPATTST